MECIGGRDMQAQDMKMAGFSFDEMNRYLMTMPVGAEREKERESRQEAPTRSVL